VKIRCLNPKHTDDTPSMHVYPERAFCFSCGYSVPSEEVASVEEIRKLNKEPTDVKNVLQYISSLPVRKIRGLYFPYDDRGFYVEWPCNTFYKKRLFEGNSRYIGPRGTRPPLYVHKQCPHDLVIVEGEINARSLYSSKATTSSIASPGSATEMLRHLDKYLTYNTIHAIIVDKDIPGVINGLKLKDELIKRGKKPILIAMEKDLNQIYEEEGDEAIKAWAKENL
jgi:hypothetical protein